MPNFYMPNSVSTYFHKLSGNAIIRRSLIALVGLVILYTVLGFLVLPAVIKSQTEKLIEKNFHRQATIGKVEVNPYTLQVTIHDFKVTEPAGKTAFLAFDTLMVNLSSESLWRFVPVVQEVKLIKPYAHLVREDPHRYNLDDILTWIANRPQSKEPARFSLHNIQLEDGRIEFDDHLMKATHTVTDLRLGIPFISSLPSQVKIFVEPLLSAKVNGTPILLKGKALPFADPKQAVVELNLDALDLTRYVEYLPLQLAAKIPSGKLDAHLTLSFQRARNATPALNLNGSASLKALRVTEADGKPILTLPELTMTLKDANLFGKRINVAMIEANGLEADLSRDRSHQWNVQKLVSTKKANAPSAKVKPASSGPALQIALDEFRIRDAAIRYNDDYATQPMHGNVDKFDLSARNIAIDTGKKAVTVGELVSEQANFLLHHGQPSKDASAKAVAQFNNAPTDTAPAEVTETTEAHTVSRKADAGYAVRVNRIRVENWTARVEDEARAHTAVTTIAPISLAVQDFATNSASPAQISLKAGVNKAGRLALSGNVGLSPLQADLSLDLANVDILPLQPYFTEQVNIKLTQAALSGKGHLQLASTQGGSLSTVFKGNMALNNVASVDKITGDDFLKWKSLAFDGVHFQSAPLALNVDQVALNNFFARVIVDPHGRINVQNITRKANGNKSVTSTEQHVANTQTSSNTEHNPPHRVSNEKTKLPNVNIKRLILQGGRVRYTDNFIKPNYSADLMDLGGTVTGLSSDPSSTASVSLHGEVNRAPLAIAGQVNPLAKDLFLDVKARVQGMDLPSLSPYSAKYIGYDIEKGKLSFEVSYLVQNRNVTAQNRLILDQLTVGDKVDSPNALNLPVRLAISLLKDRNGVIDVNVPIGGSLDDPEFSIGGIVMKIIGHAILKAVTQPFAMLGSLVGHNANEELSLLEFDPGHAKLSSNAENKLKSLAKALTERPELELEITGRADPNTDLVGLKRASVDRKVRALKYKELTERGETVAPSAVVVNRDEYPKLLAQAYLDEKFAKPRNVLGLPKNISTDEMERLMISNAPVSDNDLIALANRRALAVKDWLIKIGKVPDNRIFILASKVGGQETTANGKNAPLTRVDFSLK
jgi:uncharacterized protein involved in outer membrane biogenesis